MWKRGTRDFGAPVIKFLLPSPLYSFWKIINFDLLGGSNRRLLKFLQSLQPTGLIGWAIFKNYGENVFYNTHYAFDGWIPCAPAFFCRFFIKNKKAGPARKMVWFLFFFILLVKKHGPRQTRALLFPFFIRHALIHTISYELHLYMLQSMSILLSWMLS